MQKWMPLNIETTEEDTTKVSKVVDHNLEVVDVVDTTSVNLTAAGGDTTKWPEMGTYPITTSGEQNHCSVSQDTS
jgi:hypothetical protein